MKLYKVVVDGTEYEVGVELLSETETRSAPAPAVSKPAPAPAAPAAGGEEVRSPMPGTILSVAVQAGSQVTKGQTLMILEALKMENEIIAPRDGVVAAVSVQAGASVETDTLLCVLR